MTIARNLFVSVFLMLTFAVCAMAQNVNVTATGGMPNANYATLTDTFNAINAGTHTGTVTVDIVGNTTETATASLNASGVGASSYTSVVIRPVGGARTIEGSLSGTSAGAIVKLNGADNVTIDGRQGGTGTARNLTIRNNSNVTGAAAVWLSSVAVDAGATNNIIRNLEIACGPSNVNSLNTFGIIMSGTTISTTSNGADNDNNQFIFNRIISARYGIVTRGVMTNNNINPVVTDNIIGGAAFGPNQIGKTGIYMQADTGAIVSRNTIQYIGGDFANTTGGSDRIGIAIGTDSTGTTSSNTLTSGDYTVTKNIIHDVVEERTFSAAGIVLGTSRSGTPTNNLLANNFIYNVRANGTAGDQFFGIAIHGGNTDTIANNSISITGDMDPPGGSVNSTNFGAAIRITTPNGTNNANMSVLNNSVYLDASSNLTTTHFYAISVPSAAYDFGMGGLNYNNYYINPANPQLFTGGLAAGSAATAMMEFATLADWRMALTNPQDANSIQADPLYASITSDLHLTGASPNIDAGTTIAAITDDIDNQIRPNGAAYDIGADEFLAPSAAGASVSGRVLTAYGRRGVSRAIVTITDMNGEKRIARTNQFGYFRFEEVESGQTYIFNVSAKRYRFNPQVLSIVENLTEVSFFAIE